MKSLSIACVVLSLGGGLDAQQIPAVRPLGPTVATAGEELGPVVVARHLPSGVLVNDIQNRRLLLFDSTLKSMTVVADTTEATANAYSGRIGGLIAYRADSSLFVDPQSMSMLVIDPMGKVQRVMSVPRSQDAIALGNNAFGTPALDASGRLVYRGFPRPAFRGGGGRRGNPDRPQSTAAGPEGFTPPDIPDSTAVMRIDLTSRQVDTVAFMKIPKIKFDVQRDDNGRVNITSMANPLPTVDDFAVLSDGSIAIVRGRDYHVDFIRPDGSMYSAPKIPFEWRRLTDEDKVAFIDSVKAARERLAANAPTPVIAERPTQGADGARGGDRGGARGNDGPPGEVRVFIGGDGGGPGPGGRGGAGGFGRGQFNFVPASELPDYQPAFFAGAVRADANGNLWVRTIPTKATSGGLIYDVIDGKGLLVDRVQVPRDRVIVGFGPGNTVYLLARDANASTSRLERARIR
ncbi:MAG TPA: hypothetical protein VJ867_18095 [Gemmatimonadaceae bacterium]|nr:hypothetical protein [Gemmatimonadaceae bacterium]